MSFPVETVQPISYNLISYRNTYTYSLSLPLSLSLFLALLPSPSLLPSLPLPSQTLPFRPESVSTDSPWQFFFRTVLRTKVLRWRRWWLWLWTLFIFDPESEGPTSPSVLQGQFVWPIVPIHSTLVDVEAVPSVVSPWVSTEGPLPLPVPLPLISGRFTRRDRRKTGRIRVQSPDNRIHVNSTSVSRFVDGVQ